MNKGQILKWFDRYHAELVGRDSKDGRGMQLTVAKHELSAMIDELIDSAPEHGGTTTNLDTLEISYYEIPLWKQEMKGIRKFRPL